MSAGLVTPGSGWPGDPATSATPVAADATDVVRGAAGAATVTEVDALVSVCRACPRLVGWRERVAVERRRAYAAEQYWGRPVPGWGDQDARVLVVGLAPAAHGGNRTGRIFTGDRSGDWLFAAAHRAGLSARPTSTSAGDGQRLLGARMTAAVHCAPPDNRPTPAERATCAPWLTREVALVKPGLRAVVALGAFAWQSLWPALGAAGWAVPRPRPRFGHGVEVLLPPAAAAAAAVDSTPANTSLLVLASFHPSQQNTFTGRLTAGMLDDVLTRAASHAGLPDPGAGSALASQA